MAYFLRMKLQTGPQFEDPSSPFLGEGLRKLPYFHLPFVTYSVTSIS